MLGKGEHIDGLDPFDLISALAEREKIARERFGVAGNVNDGLRREGDERIEKLLTASYHRVKSKAMLTKNTQFVKCNPPASHRHFSA
mgnify:CR=1 FL=1